MEIRGIFGTSQELVANYYLFSEASGILICFALLWLFYYYESTNMLLVALTVRDMSMPFHYKLTRMKLQYSTTWDYDS